jgi:hypothetical protein
MKLILEKTDQIVTVNDIPARVWTGRTESGIEVQVLVTRIAVLKTDDNSQFQAELQEESAPAPTLQAFPLRMIL